MKSNESLLKSLSQNNVVHNDDYASRPRNGDGTCVKSSANIERIRHAIAERENRNVSES